MKLILSRTHLKEFVVNIVVHHQIKKDQGAEHFSVFLLGNLLIIRQEMELLAQWNNTSTVVIHFVGNLKEPVPVFFYEAFSSEIEFNFVFSQDSIGPFDWPPQDLLTKWKYSSFKRLALLVKNTGCPLQLQWPAFVLEKARAVFSGLTSQKDGNITAIHLKRQSTNREESNADSDAWKSLFEENMASRFFLLGNDLIPDEILELPNVISAKQLNMSLAAQLAFCSIADGFLGMASGVCPGAIFSDVPYIIFKHPNHHTKEMEDEIGNADHFPFAKNKQKLWRKVDNIDNLRKAWSMIKSFT